MSVGLTSERKQLLDELVESNVSLTQIQKKYGFNYRTIRKYHPRYRLGVTNADVTREKLRKHEEIVNQLAEERVPGGLIATVVGVGYHALSRHRPDLMWTRTESVRYAAMVRQLNQIKML